MCGAGVFKWLAPGIFARKVLLVCRRKSCPLLHGQRKLREGAAGLWGSSILTGSVWMRRDGLLWRLLPSAAVVVACCVRCCYAILCCAVWITHLPLPSLFFSSEDDTRVLSSSFSEERRTSAFLNSKTRSSRGTTSLFCWMGRGKCV